MSGDPVPDPVPDYLGPPYRLEECHAAAGGPIEFRTFEELPGSAGAQRELDALAVKLAAADDCRRYLEAYNGAPFEPAPCRGTTSLEVLPQLKGTPFDNLALAWLHALRPSVLRVVGGSSRGALCLDGRADRVTVHLDERNLITRVEQEVGVGYGCGHDLDLITRARRDGTRPLAPSGVYGHVGGLERINF